MVTADVLPIDTLQGFYELGSWLSVERLPGGKNQHYRIVTGRGEYVLRRSYRSKSPEGIRFEHELIVHLRQGGFPAPAVVPSARGETYVADDGRLYVVSVFVNGSPYRAGDVGQLRQVARALATYHRLVASFEPSSPRPQEPFLHESLRKRLSALPAPEALVDLPAGRGDADPRMERLLAAVPYIRQEGEAVLSVLDRLYRDGPLLTIHAGCRRGSVLFEGDRLVAVLDFDSARFEARALDLAVALHDFAKVYGDPASPGYKVLLDVEVVARFLDAYRQVVPLEPAEVEALPALLVAKRLKRALGRYERVFAGEPLSDGDVRKMGLEIARVRQLEADRRELYAALAGAGAT